MAKIAINGFGRIGRLAFRRIIENHPSLEIAAVNDLGSPENSLYLLQHDSVYGRFAENAKLLNGKLEISGRSVLFLSEPNAENLPWKKLGVDVVLECTGKLTKREDASKHLKAGAKKAVISANSKDADFSVVLGVNERDYDPQKHAVISNCSCTTNCAAPVLKVLDGNFGVEKAQLMTVHGVTASQNLVDGQKKDMREGRAAFANIIPAGTGASDAVVRVLPKLQDKILGSAFRVPILAGSILQIVAQTQKETTKEKIIQALQKAADNELKGILQVSDEELVSSDIVKNPSSAIVDAGLTEVLEPDFVKVSAWYDNEYGYACRLVEIAEMVAQKL